jgi:hypothetical protein
MKNTPKMTIAKMNEDFQYDLARFKERVNNAIDDLCERVKRSYELVIEETMNTTEQAVYWEIDPKTLARHNVRKMLYRDENSPW